MTPDQWRRVRELFEQALDLPASDVRGWLERQEMDPVVVGEVVSLMSHHATAGSFLAPGMPERVVDLLAEDTVFEPGSALGGYVVEKEIGRGGMGRVYLATDTRLGRNVALKVLAPRFVRDETQRERLRHEARAAAALSHPGICTIYALEEIDGHVVIAAEYINGQSFRDEVAAADRPSPRALLDAGRELTSALAAAHAVGITHRDLKPENVMRTGDGRLKILDFGLALVEPPGVPAVSSRVTTPGMLVGTLLYMAPEQLEGGPVDVRADLFALGVMLYEYATGIHPFEARSGMGVAARILAANPTPIATARSDMPRPLARVVDRCLRKDKDERFTSAGDALAMLASDDVRPLGAGGVVWWRNHMVAIVVLYLVAVAAAWLAKEWNHGLADAGFVIVAMSATVGGVLRGHLLFAEWTHERMNLLQELHRTSAPLAAVDLICSIVLVLEGLWVAASRPVGGVLIVGLGLVIALARLVLERSTTRAAFGA